MKSKQYLNNQQITLRDTLETPVSRFAQPDSERVILLAAGCVLGLVIMFTVQKCQPAPAAALSINSMECRLCHAQKLDTYKKYRTYHRAMRPSSNLLAELVRP